MIIVPAHRLRFLVAAILATALSFPTWASATQLVGRVVRVVDGDTLVILAPNKDQYRVRLADIDAPETSGQPFSRASRESLASMVAGKTISITVMDRDRYGRTVGRIFIGGTNINREQVRRGLAWTNTRWNRDALMPAIELQARAQRRGLWAEPYPVPPWEWRKTRR